MRGTTKAVSTTRKPTRFQVWYEENKRTISRNRRKRYKTDSAYRERVLNHTRVYRKAISKTHKPRPGFSVTEAAIRIGRTAQTIREWEKHKLIPKTRDDRGYRRYTSSQIALLKTLGKALDDFRYRRVTKDKVKAVKAAVRENWNAR